MRPSTWGQRWGSGRPEVAGSTSTRAAAAWPPLPRAPQASRAADVRPAGLAPARGRGDVTTPEAPLSVLPAPRQSSRPRGALAGGPRLVEGRVPSVRVFPRPCGRSVGGAWAWTPKTQASRRLSPLFPQQSRPPPASVPRPWAASGRERGAGCAPEHVARGVGGARRHHHVTSTILSAPALRVVPRPEAGPGRRPADAAGGARCVPGSPGPAVPVPGPPCRPGGPGRSADSPCRPAPQHSGSCCRPGATWPRGCGSRAGSVRSAPPSLLGAVAGGGSSPFLSHIWGCCWGSGSGSLPGPPS